MRLQRLTLRDFRGVTERVMKFPDAGVTVVLGDNETGKSSLLEAFDLLLRYRADSTHRQLLGVRPVGRDIGTFVEACFTLGDLSVRYRKRWFAERVTELEITHPDGRRSWFTGREAHDQAARLFAQHVDQTLWSALVVGQEDSLLMPAPREVTAVLTALDSADGGSGDEAVPLVEAVEREYRRYFTPKEGKRTGEYAHATTHVERATAAVATAEAAAAEVEADVQRAESLAVAREGLIARVAAQDAEVARLSEAREQVAGLLAKRDRLRGEAALAHERLKAASSRHAERRALIADVESRDKTVATASATGARAVEALRKAEAELNSESSSLRSMREAQVLARSAVARLDTHLSALRDQRELASVIELLGAVSAAREAERVALLAVESNPVTAAVAEQLEAARRAVLGAQAAAEASAPKVEVRPLSPAASVLVDGIAVDSTSVVAAARDLTVQVPDVVEVTIRPGEGAAELQAALATAHHAEESLLAAVDLPDIFSVRQKARVRAEAEHALEVARETLTRRLGASTFEQVSARRDLLAARCADLVLEPDLPSDLDEIRSLLSDARDAEATALGALDDTEQRELAARKEFEVARETATTARVRLEQSTERHAEVVASLSSARASTADESLDEVLAEATAAVDSLLRSLTAAVEELTAAGADQLSTALATAHLVRAELARQLDRDTGDLRRIEGRLEQAGAQGIASEVERARAALDGAQRRLEILDRRARAAMRLRETLERHRASAHRRYAAPLRERIDALGRMVYGPSFGVVLGDDLSVVARTLADNQVPVSSLSTGAREQLATIVRLAIAGLTSDDGVPVVLDDALGWSDPSRLQAMGALLSKAGESGQVLLLTSVPDRYKDVAGATVIRM